MTWEFCWLKEETETDDGYFDGNKCMQVGVNGDRRKKDEDGDGG